MHQCERLLGVQWCSRGIFESDSEGDMPATTFVGKTLGEVLYESDKDHGGATKYFL
ncbi:hypothetical protein OCU04_009689 [Sclerotinia nivalis]|uniref:Uncharacterized protein n=1 Tax=Sclerotinia nivalis TaxID=352851 RepID=A0A9X0AFW4_9HELO|nr:hypothetical protein OCU04_009689 [Sclerotinia nivalis]